MLAQYVYAICGYHTYRPQEIHFFGFFLDKEKAQKEVDRLDFHVPQESEFAYQLREYKIGELAKQTLNYSGLDYIF